MREKELINIIKETVKSDYIGDDCAYLKDLGIVVTQDSLVENVHFSLDFATPYQLGYKSVMVNLSDVYAGGGEPKYITISLSLPSYTGQEFVKEFYEGVNDACKGSVKVIGGDLTGSDKIYVSVCAIGTTNGHNVSSRRNAKAGYKVVVSGHHGSSALGLKMLLSKTSEENQFIKAHLMPEIQGDFATEISKTVKEPYAMMDTSDGLMDALSAVANESGVCLDIDFEKIPHDKDIENYDNWQDLVLFGGEDYGIVAVIPEKYEVNAPTIGYVKEGDGVYLKMNGSVIKYSKKDVENKIFNHFS